VLQPALLRVDVGGSVVPTRPCSTASKVCDAASRNIPVEDAKIVDRALGTLKVFLVTHGGGVELLVSPTTADIRGSEVSVRLQARESS
jgi:hypothetical protein